MKHILRGFPPLTAWRSAQEFPQWHAPLETQQKVEAMEHAREPDEAVMALAGRIAGWLGAVEGVAAVALGGSWARGEATPASDIDIGLYYHPDAPPDIEALRRAARELGSGPSADAVTGLGAWGPWINGGAWLTIEGHRVDWIYRDVSLVAATIEDCRAGRAASYFQPGHPHAFHTHIYLGEVFWAIPLHDPRNVLAALKERAAPYPPLLKAELVRQWAWQAQFALAAARKGADRADTFYATGALFQCAAALVQVLFALNERYYMNEKGAVSVVDAFPIRPIGFSGTVRAILGHPGTDAAALHGGVRAMEALANDTFALCADSLAER